MSLIYSKVPPWLTSEVGRVIFHLKLEEKNICAADNQHAKKLASLETYV